MKQYCNLALFSAILAMAGGVFYREFTKFQGFTGRTQLAFVHTHYFLLGMVFFLLLLLLEKMFSFTQKRTKYVLCTYQIGLHIACIAMVVRGITQVLGTTISKAFDASLSGVAGIGHILLGVSMVILLLDVRRAVVQQNAKNQK